MKKPTIKEVRNRISGKRNVNNWLAAFGYNKKQIEELKAKARGAKKVKSEVPAEAEVISKTGNSDVFFNEMTKSYVITLPSMSEPLILPEERIKAIRDNYSAFCGKPLTVNHLASKFGLSRQTMKELLSRFGMTKDDIPVTDRDVDTKSEELLLQELRAKKKMHLRQQAEIDDWKQINKDAAKWRTFEAGKFEPMKQLLDSWAPKADPFKFSTEELKKDVDEKVMVVGLSDLHYGAQCDGRGTLTGVRHMVADIDEQMRNYCLEVIRRGKARGVKHVVVLGLGDTLHGLRGTTQKGTKLKYGELGPDQFERAFDSLSSFFDTLSRHFQVVDVHAVHGNHEHTDGYILFFSLEKYFQTRTNITFHNSLKRIELFEVSNTLICMEHGASAEYDHKIPSSQQGKELWIRRTLRDSGKDNPNVKSTLYVAADIHHRTHSEFNGIEFMTFGTPVKADDYADAYGLRSRPSQSILILGEDGYEATEVVYFD